MGVPKFFRYTSERYPCLNELVKQYQIPDFDNMYLDMNGIIHNCSHPDDSNPHFRITEEKIFEDIFHYLSILFQIIKPRKLFFMAIDGVAPRAKMNQQRGRRFRSAREAEKLEEEAKAKGESLPTEKRFDSNCITPGTVFMARLHEQLKYFVKKKMSTDPLWSKVKVILSGHETPGEGEHKIMDYIRWARSQPDYDPNTRHCLYGLDADLIMLGMCTHEPHFALLREEVKFGKTTQRATSPEETNFFLLHLSLLKEYLAEEFITIKDKIPFEYDIEKIVDDWVLMGFLVGNDFIPNLPNMHISNDALPILYKTYMDVLPTLDGYINEAGELNLRRFEVFMQELAKIDREKFQDTYADLKYFEAKTGRRPNANERKEYKPNNDETFGASIDELKANRPDDELQALIDATADMYMDDMDFAMDGELNSETSDDETNFNMEFKLHKHDYYMNKLDYSKVTEEVLASQAEGYVRAIQWNLWYYYRGCASWCWYYPHHYAPYISDIKGFADLKIEFELGEPFKPFEQLLAVLPAASKQLLPTPFHALMTDEDSVIVHYYPINFETDLNGKKNDWEAVVLIPFIDETNLLSAMEPCYQRLTDEERRRNSHGPMMLYTWSKDNLGPALAPEYFPPIPDCRSIETQIWRRDLDVPLERLKRGVLPNAMKDVLFPGFPTMRHLKYKTELKKCKVKVFDQPSRNESVIVQIVREEAELPLEETAKQLLGTVVWAGWPHLTKAKVISVSNEKMRLHLASGAAAGAAPYTTEPNAGNLHKQWISERSTIIEHNMNRLGIELGNVTTIIHAVNLKGYKYIIQDNTTMALEEQWCSVPCGYALQALVPQARAIGLTAPMRCRTVRDAYPAGDTLFLLTQGQYYGAHAKVMDAETARSGRIKVSVRERPQPRPAPAPALQAPPYKTAHHAAASIGITPQLLSRVTGSVLVVAGPRRAVQTEGLPKINIGCNLKFNKKNLEVAGYTRRAAGAWLYSARCVSLVADYSRQFPALFDALAHSRGDDIFFECDLWPGEEGKGKPQEVQAWLKAQPHHGAVKRQCGSEALEPEELRALAASIDDQLEGLKGQEKAVTLHVKWNLLYKAELHEGNVSPDAAADFRLFDRVVCVAGNITVPSGAEGTITAIYNAGPTNTVRLSDKLNCEATYQVMFDKPFAGGMKEDLVDEARFYRMSPTFMLNISYGRKLRGSTGAGAGREGAGAWRAGAAGAGGAGAGGAGDQPAFRNTPTLLRREGQHSAFANYSPTTDHRHTPASVTPVAPVTVTPLTVTPMTAATSTIDRITPATRDPMQSVDSSTMLLKNLLKISESGSGGGTKKSNKSSNDQQNWRNRTEPMTLKQPLIQTKPQTPNRRKEPTPAFDVRPQHDRNDRNYKPQQPPLLPFPSFAPPPFQQPLAQIPLPPFVDTRHHGNHNAIPHHGNQETSRHHGNQDAARHGNRQNGQFPSTLPVVTGTVLAPPGRSGHGLPSSRAAADQLSNPFVPLQVQASQRRVQNPVVSSNRAEHSARAPPAAAPAPREEPVDQKPSQQQTKPRPQRKKKPRIAANLPFSMD